MAGRSGVRRWLTFNAVGVAGVGVQLLALAVLTELARLDYLASTALAVETAILHNFFWHERWTWGDRRAGRRRTWERLARFNVVSGVGAISANVVLTGLYSAALGVHYLFANMMAIASWSLANFLANDRFVFRLAEADPAEAAWRAGGGVGR